MSGFPNLLPKAMLVKCSRRRRVRRWVFALSLEAVLVAAVGIELLSEQIDPDAPARTAIESTVGQIDLVTAALAESQGKLQAVEQQLAVASEVVSKPDWSIVLAAIAMQGQGVVVLTNTQLTPPTLDTETGVVSYRLSMLGACGSQAELTRFVRAIEGTGIFSKVKVLETRRLIDPENPEDTTKFRVGFSIDTWLAEGGD